MMQYKRITLAVALIATLAIRPARAEERVIKASDDGRRISIELAKSEIRDALRLIAQSGNINLIIGPDIEGNVSVHLDNVPVEVALKAIAINNNLRYSVAEGVVTISRPPIVDPNSAPPTMVTRAFKLRAQDAARVKEAIEHVLTKYGRMTVLNENSDANYTTSTLNSLSGDIESLKSNSGSSSSFSNSTGNGAGRSTSQNGAQSGSQSGQFATVAQNSHTLIVTDIEEKVNLVASLIADLDRLPPQVLIEARIVEMSTNLQRQLGIDWNAEAFANGPILNHELPLHNRAGFASGDQIRRDFTGVPYQSAGLALGTVDLSKLSALLKANQDDTAIRLLANPRMLVFNNHSANILVGERYPIFQANVSNFGTVTEAFQTYIPVGTQLEVTPTIMSDSRVSLQVHPATSALGDNVVGTTGLTVARIQVREISTRVIMRDNETIVLGGLISDRKTHTASKVPGLGDWAGLSIFFRQERPSSDRVDLLVFLTARIEGATRISDRDQKVFDMYQPHFKQVERLQDVPLHFEIPTEYEPPKPRFTDPPAEKISVETDMAPPVDMTAPAPQRAPTAPSSDSDALEPLPGQGTHRAPPPPTKHVAAPPAPRPITQVTDAGPDIVAILNSIPALPESAEDTGPVPMNTLNGGTHAQNIRIAPAVGFPGTTGVGTATVRANQPAALALEAARADGDTRSEYSGEPVRANQPADLGRPVAPSTPRNARLVAKKTRPDSAVPPGPVRGSPDQRGRLPVAAGTQD